MALTKKQKSELIRKEERKNTVLKKTDLWKVLDKEMPNDYEQTVFFREMIVVAESAMIHTVANWHCKTFEQEVAAKKKKFVEEHLIT